MSAEIKAINCTSCGATLDVLGGHRVKSLACGYCGSVMDRHAGFQVLQQHRHRPERPATPLAIGMQATLKGVPFTVIGMIEYVSHQSGPGWAESYRWVSFQLYSPTHGYCWLTWNKGHYFFSYRTRELPNPVVPDGLLPKHTVRLDGRIFQLFEAYVAEIDYVEGEFTWVAKVGDKVHVAEAIDPPGMFSFEQSATEYEYSIGEYMDADEVHDAFGLEAAPTPVGIHPAQPFRPGRIWQALAKAGPIFAGIAALGLVFAIIAGNGRELVRTQTGATREPVALPFTVGNPNRLLKLELAASISNNWAYYNVTVSDAATGDDVLALGKEISFYEGRDSDGYWSEGSRSARALFKVPAAGDYKIEIIPAETGGSIPPLSVRLYDGVVVKRYIVALLIVSVLAAVALHFRRHWFERKRWADILEDDDD
jgi:hypothetical protein